MQIRTSNIIEILIDLIIGIVSAIFLDVLTGVLLAIALFSIALNRIFIQTDINKYNKEMVILHDEMKQISYTTMILDKSIRITESDLIDYKYKILKSAADELNTIYTFKKSKFLETDFYYDMLFTYLKDAIEKPKGRKIWAVSLMLSIEWDDSEWERQFLELNLEAVKKGVFLERVFIVKKAELNNLLNIHAILKQFELSKTNHNMTLRVAKMEDLERTRLLKEVGCGFIAFDDSKIMIDVLDEKSNLMRGYLDVNSEVIEEKKKVFNRLVSASALFGDIVSNN